MTTASSLPGGAFQLGDHTVSRVGFGAMQLAGPGVFGPPADRAEAIAVLRTAVELGVNHIDTADFYGPYITNEIIREALAPYPDDLVIVTKVGAVRDESGGWVLARTPADLRQQVHDNLKRLGVDALDAVNLRVGGGEDGHSAVDGSLGEQFAELAALRDEGLIRNLGLSVVNAEQLAEAQAIAPVVCVQNFYNLAGRHDQPLLDLTASQSIAYVPFFPLGGFSPLQSDELNAVAARLGATPMQVALAWLLQRSPNLLLIPGTSSVAHERENVAAGALELDAETVAELDAIEAAGH
jgi:aryl-alcohol dehydrogenase-like predicted oxidoreductase